MYQKNDLRFGIDQSLNSTAWCLTSRDGKLLDYGLIRLNPNDTQKHRQMANPPKDKGLASICTENWNELEKIWQQFYLAKAVSARLGGVYYRTIRDHDCFGDPGSNIAHVVIEGLAMGSNGDATRGLAGLQFFILDSFNEMLSSQLTARPFGVKIIAPTSLKKFATGKGRFKGKEPMFEALPEEIQEIFGKFPKTKGRYDLVDAYWLAMIGFREDET